MPMVPAIRLRLSVSDTNTLMWPPGGTATAPERTRIKQEAAKRAALVRSPHPEASSPVG